MKRQKIMSAVLSLIIASSAIPAMTVLADTADTDAGNDSKQETGLDETDQADDKKDDDKKTDDASDAKTDDSKTEDKTEDKAEDKTEDTEGEDELEAEPTPEPKPAKTPRENIKNFVNRMYLYVLARAPEAQGSEYWTNELYNFRRSGAELAFEFVFSEEYKAANYNNTKFVRTLYRTFFARLPDEEGMAYWKGLLESGTSREEVASGFIYSQEWADVCANYGIRSGGELKAKVEIEPTDATYAFVERMYTTAMQRESDEDGKNYWAKSLANFSVTGEAVGASFFLSKEMEDYKLSDEEFINRLYATFMNREADADGLNYWLGVLKGGDTRSEVVYGFTRSEEFTKKCIEARILPC